MGIHTTNTQQGTPRHSSAFLAQTTALRQTCGLRQGSSYTDAMLLCFTYKGSSKGLWKMHIIETTFAFQTVFSTRFWSMLLRCSVYTPSSLQKYVTAPGVCVWAHAHSEAREHLYIQKQPPATAAAPVRDAASTLPFSSYHTPRGRRADWAACGQTQIRTLLLHSHLGM